MVTERDLLPETADARRGPLHPDSIAVGTYANDHHYQDRTGRWRPRAAAGVVAGRNPFAFPIKLSSDKVSNLLAAEKCFSVSHMANGATRLQPLILNIGQAAGLAASLAVRRGVDPGVIPAQHIQQRLIDDPIAPAAVLPIWDWPAWHPDWRSAQQRGLDDLDAVSINGSLSPDSAGRSEPSAQTRLLWNGKPSGSTAVCSTTTRGYRPKGLKDHKR